MPPFFTTQWPPASKPLLAGGGKRRLRIKLAVAQREIEIRREQRLEDLQRLFRPPAFTAQAFAVPAAAQRDRSDLLRLQFALQLETVRRTAVQLQRQHRRRQMAAIAEADLIRRQLQLAVELRVLFIAPPAQRLVEAQARRGDRHQTVLLICREPVESLSSTSSLSCQRPLPATSQAACSGGNRPLPQ